jgi:hypothetical protein
MDAEADSFSETTLKLTVATMLSASMPAILMFLFI